MEEMTKKPWYKRWWGILLILIIGGILSVVIAATIYVVNVAQKISREEISPKDLVNGSRTTSAGLDQIDISGRPFIGAENAPVVIVEFLDFECPFCRQSHQVINSIISNPKYKNKVKFVFRYFPLIGDHPNALLAAQAAECAWNQKKFWEMADLIFSNQAQISEANLKRYAISLNLDSLKFSQCLNSEEILKVIEADLRYGVKLGVEATPVFFVNGKRINGALSESELEQLIDLLLQ
jgi:protein-disulfide isomerase